LIIGAGRGLGYAMAEEFLKRGWNVVGTVRPGMDRTPLHDLEDKWGRVEVATIDINDQQQIAALGQRLSGRTFQILFVNAGIATSDQQHDVDEVSNEEFNLVMMTNALSPMRVIVSLQHLVPATGMIGAMSSGQGSIANNETGRREVYRSSKAALNQFMRSFAAREPSPQRAMVVIAPGWVRTNLGGPGAPLSIEESIPKVVDVLLEKMKTPGLQYLDRFGETVPW
jgi:NAD(P)-dependent dehydrogenase (short-subunit alcohol dehydrogenase family)